MVDTATKLRRVWIATPKVIYLVLLVLLGITFSDLKDRERNFDNADTRILQNIFENANKAPIYDISLASNTGYCSSIYDHVILGKWDGSIEGCLCGSTYYAGACTSSSCSKISAITSNSFFVYDGVQFCAGRVSSWTNTSPSGTCSSGYTLCAANICVPDSVICPITDIQYASPSTIPTGYEYITINSSLVLAFTNKVRNAAITSLQVSLYDRPCMDPDAMPLTTTGSAYLLSAVPENGCGGTGTVEHLQQISNKNASLLFPENNMNAIVTGLPGFSTYIASQYAFFVGARQYLAMNDSNCPTISTSYLTNCKSYENSFVNNVYGVLIAALVVVSVIFCLTIIEFVFLARRKEEEDHWTRFFSIVNLLTLLGLCVLCIIIGVNAASTKHKLSPDVAVLNSWASNQCFKQEVVNRILQVLRGNVANYYAILWLSICQLIVACVGIIATVLVGLINIGYAKRHGGFESYYKSVGKGSKRKGMGVQSGAKTPVNIEMLISTKSVVH